MPSPKAPEETLLSPQVGQSPPTAICVCQTGPAARLLRLKAYASPFLLIDVTSWSPLASLNRVVDVPKSESSTASDAGSFQESVTSRVLALMAR